MAVTSAGLRCSLLFAKPWRHIAEVSHELTGGPLRMIGSLLLVAVSAIVPAASARRPLAH